MEKVLIIEDNQQLIRMYQRVLSYAGYEVEGAYNGEEGLSKAKSFNPSIILLDIMMPKMNGLEVLDKLKEDADTKKIPVVMMSNLSEETKAKEALQKGAIKYINKSDSDPTQVTEVIKEVLGSK